MVSRLVILLRFTILVRADPDYLGGVEHKLASNRSISVDYVPLKTSVNRTPYVNS